MIKIILIILRNQTIMVQKGSQMILSMLLMYIQAKRDYLRKRIIQP